MTTDTFVASGSSPQSSPRHGMTPHDPAAAPPPLLNWYSKSTSVHRELPSGNATPCAVGTRAAC
jgi:hypothetical protein